MPLFGPPNVEKLKTQRDVMGLVKALSYSKNQEVQRQAAEALGQVGDARAVEPLVVTLQDPYSTVRLQVAAAESLGKIGDGRAVEPLVAALKHPRGEVLLSVEYHFASLTNKFFTRLLERSQ
jgi:HEAT repeat protein